MAGARMDGDVDEAPVRVLDRWDRVVGYEPDLEGHVNVIERDGYEPAGLVFSQAAEMIRGEMADARKLVEAGRKSPLWYYMILHHLDCKTLGQYVGISRWRVAWHMRPGAFARLDARMLERYARTLLTTPEGVKTLPAHDPEPSVAVRADDREEG